MAESSCICQASVCNALLWSSINTFWWFDLTGHPYINTFLMFLMIYSSSFCWVLCNTSLLQQCRLKKSPTMLALSPGWYFTNWTLFHSIREKSACLGTKLPQRLSLLHYRLPQTAHLQIRRWPGSGKKKCLGTCDDTELARVWPSSTYNPENTTLLYCQPDMSRTRLLHASLSS